MHNHTHLIGVGGIGMSGIARLLLNRGAKVSGSDLSRSTITDELKGLGADIFIGHHPSNIKGAGLVVYSSAISGDNPEILEAKRRNIALMRRAQALAELMRNDEVIAITGSHGKTTTTSLASCLLMEAGLSPSVMIGGVLRNIDNSACRGRGKFFITEADESDGTFLYYRPKYSIVTNIDREHLDYYKEFSNALSTFKEFLNKTDPAGCVFCCADDLNLASLAKDYKGRHILFGLEENSHVYPKNIKINGLTSEFDCFYKGKFIDRFLLALGGEHNISNALAVIALGLELGIEPKFIKKALSGFRGAKRRAEVKFESRDYLLIDDYAHHPTEIKATLSAMKNLGRRVIAVFQPHRYSRTKLLMDEFAKSFDLADYVIITDIYPANELPIEGVDSQAIYNKIKSINPRKEAVFMPKARVCGHVLEAARAGDLVITLGAGDISRICDELVERFKNQSRA